MDMIRKVPMLCYHRRGRRGWLTGWKLVDGHRGHIILLLLLGTLRVTAVMEGDVRLTGNGCKSEGRVEIYHAEAAQVGRWGTICYNGFSETEATVTCRQLGYDGGATLRPRGESQLSIWLAAISCSMHQRKLTDCLLPGAQWGGEECDEDGTAGVHCYNDDADIDCAGNPVEVEGGVKLAGDCPYSGQFLVYSRHRWGTVCPDGFDDVDAVVACRQLGYKAGWSLDVMSDTIHQQSVWLSDVSCGGDEMQLTSCPHNPRHVVSCDVIDGRRAGVTCSNTTDRKLCDGSIVNNKERDLRLEDGLNKSEGRLEVFYHGHWGTLCDSQPVSNFLDWACTTMGYDHGERLLEVKQPGSDVIKLAAQTCHLSAISCKLKVVKSSQPCQMLGIRCYNGPKKKTCESVHCLMGAMCIDGADGPYCQCPPGLRGAHCQLIYTPCRSSPCLNGGTCTENEANFECSCSQGFGGGTCQISLDGKTTLPKGLIAILGSLAALIGATIILGIWCWWRRRRRRIPRFRLQEDRSMEFHDREEYTDGDAEQL